MRRSRAGVALLCTPLLLVGCSGDEAATGTLTVEGTVSVCPESGRCTELPAAGAAVRVYDGAGRRVEAGTLDSRGRFVVEVPAGSYGADLSMPALGLSIPRDDISVASVGEDGAADLAVTFPAIHVQR